MYILCSFETVFLFAGRTDYQTFYISFNGSDVSTCGGTAENACETLAKVLSIFYSRTHYSQMGLKIITSTSLYLNQQIVVSLLQLFGSYPEITSSS